MLIGAAKKKSGERFDRRKLKGGRSAPPRLNNCKSLLLVNFG